MLVHELIKELKVHPPNNVVHVPSLEGLGEYEDVELVHDSPPEVGITMIDGSVAATYPPSTAHVRREEEGSNHGD